MKMNLKSENVAMRTIALTVVTMLCLYPVPAMSLPGGSKVVSGSATIAQPNTTTLKINQTTNKAIINWNNFSINVNELVQFTQPGKSSVVLNRVVGVDPSSIFGRLSANGRVFIVNPNGIVFGPNSSVDAAGLFATTLGIKDADFLAGKYLFNQDPTKPGSYIINQGQIKVSDNGFVFLVAPGVQNEGLIIANLGKVVLASGNQFTVDFVGDGLINFVVDGKVIDNVLGPDGNALSSAVSNSGVIKADGGQVILSAKASGDIFSSVVNNSGIIEAKSLVNHGGVIRLEGSDPVENTGELGWQANLGNVKNGDGAVINSGTLDVSAAEPGAAQGQVTLSGQLVGVSGPILANGADGAQGGRVLVTSTDQTILTNNAIINTSGVGNSNAGNVIVWSDNTTLFAGTILAQGGNLGGNGGNVEVSGHQNLGFYGVVDLTAPLGLTGTVLLDPRLLSIIDGPAGSSDFDYLLLDFLGNIQFTILGDISLSVGQINATGANNNIFLNAGQIDFNNSQNIVMGATHSISFSTDKVAGGGGNDNITNAGGNAFSITTSGIGDISFSTKNGGLIDLTNITLNTGANGAVFINTFGLTLGSVTLGSVNSGFLSIGAGAISNAAGAHINVNDGVFFGTSIDLGNGNGDAVDISRLGLFIDGTATVRTTGSTAVYGSIDGNLNLAVGGALTQSSSTSCECSNDFTVGGNANFGATSIDLGGDPPFHSQSLTFNSSGSVSIIDDGPIMLTGTNTAASLILVSSFTSDGVSLGSITNTADTTLTVVNNASFSAPDFFGAIDLGNKSNDLMNFGSLTFNGGAVNITENSSTLIVGNNTASSLTLVSSGAITDDPTMSLTVTGNANFSGTSIVLGDNAGETLNFGSLTFNSDGNVDITEASDTLLTGINTANNLNLTSSGFLTNTSGTQLTVRNLANFRAASIDLGNQLGDTMNFGKLTFNSDGSVNIFEDSDTILTGNNTAQTLLLAGSGSLTNDPGTRLVVQGLTTLDFDGFIDIGNQPGDFFNLPQLNANTRSSLKIAVNANIQLIGNFSATRFLLSSTGTVTDLAGNNYTIGDDIIQIIAAAGSSIVGNTNGAIVVINNSVPGGISNFDSALSRSQEQLTSVVSETIVLIPANMIQIDDELKRRLNITDGFGDIRLALAAVTLITVHDSTFIAVKNEIGKRSLSTVNLPDVPSIATLQINDAGAGPKMPVSVNTTAVGL